jgi:hypothetical protein
MAVDAGSLSFWRAKAGKRPQPAAVYAALEAGETPGELEDLDPRKVMAALRKQYPSAAREGEVLAVDLDDEQAGFEVRASKKHVHVDFFGDAFRQMDRVVAMMRGMGLACYDVGAQKLYPPDKPPPQYEMTPAESAPLDAMFAAMQRHAEQTRAATNDPQERLKMLKSFIDSGAMQREVAQQADEASGRPPRRKKRKT